MQDASRFEAPLDFSSLKEVHTGKKKTFIVHIQDAHANLSGQENLAAALDQIMEKYKIKLILVEGGTRDDSLTPLKKLAAPKTWKRVAKKFLMEGKISGEEYLNLTSDHPMKIVGIEDKALYMQSLEAYAALAEKRETSLSELKKVRGAIEKLKKKIYPQVLWRYEKAKAADKDAFERSFKELLGMAEAGERARFANIERWNEVALREARIDFAAANLEQASLAEKTKYSSKAPKNGKLSQLNHVQRLFEHAAKNSVSLQDYPELSKYREYLTEFTGIDLEALLDEKLALEDEVYRRLLTTEDAKLVRCIDRYLGLLEPAYRIQMSTKEFDSFKRNEQDYATVPMLAFINAKLAEHSYFSDMLADTTVFQDSKKSLEAFYASVDQRDQAFIANTERILKEEGEEIAVLIAGGYHTPHLRQLFREKEYSYAILSPNVTSETNQAKYEKVLLEPLKKQVPTVTSGKALEEDIELLIKKKDGVRAVPASESGARLAEIISYVKPEGDESAAEAALEALRPPGVGVRMAVLAEKRGVGKVYAARAWEATLSPEDREDVYKQLNILRVGAFPNSAPVKSAQYIATDDSGRVTGYIASSIERQKARLSSLVSAKRGTGTLLMDAYMNDMRKKGVTTVEWVSSITSIGFYHRYLASRMDYEVSTAGIFTAHLDTYGKLSWSHVLAQQFHLQMILLRESIVRGFFLWVPHFAGSLELTSQGQRFFEHRLERGKWLPVRPEHEDSASTAQDRAKSLLIYDPSVRMVDDKGRVRLFASHVRPKQRVTGARMAESQDMSRRRFLQMTGAMAALPMNSFKEQGGSEVLPAEAEKRLADASQALLKRFEVIRSAGLRAEIFSSTDLDELKRILSRKPSVLFRPIKDANNPFSAGEDQIIYVHPQSLADFDPLGLQAVILHEAVHLLPRQLRSRTLAFDLYRQMVGNGGRILLDEVKAELAKKIAVRILQAEWEAIHAEFNYLQSSGVGLKAYFDAASKRSKNRLIKVSYEIRSEMIGASGIDQDKVILALLGTGAFQFYSGVKSALPQIFAHETKRSAVLFPADYDQWIVQLFKTHKEPVAPSGARLGAGRDLDRRTFVGLLTGLPGLWQRVSERAQDEKLVDAFLAPLSREKLKRFDGAPTQMRSFYFRDVPYERYLADYRAMAGVREKVRTSILTVLAKEEFRGMRQETLKLLADGRTQIVLSDRVGAFSGGRPAIASNDLRLIFFDAKFFAGEFTDGEREWMTLYYVVHELLHIVAPQMSHEQVYRESLRILFPVRRQNPEMYARFKYLQDAAQIPGRRRELARRFFDGVITRDEDFELLDPYRLAWRQMRLLSPELLNYRLATEEEIVQLQLSTKKVPARPVHRMEWKGKVVSHVVWVMNDHSVIAEQGARLGAAGDPADANVAFIAHRSDGSIEELSFDAPSQPFTDLEQLVDAARQAEIKARLKERSHALKIVVTVPTFDSASYISASLAHYLNELSRVIESHPSWSIELAVSLNGPDQELTFEELLRFQRDLGRAPPVPLTILRLDRRGKAGALNAGAAYARAAGADIFGMMDDDIRYESDPFTPVFDALTQDPSLWLTGPKSGSWVYSEPSLFEQFESLMNLGAKHLPYGTGQFMPTEAFPMLPMNLISDDSYLVDYFLSAGDRPLAGDRVSVQPGSIAYYRVSGDLFAHLRRLRRTFTGALQLDHIFADKTIAETKRRATGRSMSHKVLLVVRWASAFGDLRTPQAFVLAAVWFGGRYWMRWTTAMAVRTRKWLGKDPYHTPWGATAKSKIYVETVPEGRPDRFSPERSIQRTGARLAKAVEVADLPTEDGQRLLSIRFADTGKVLAFHEIDAAALNDWAAEAGSNLTFEPFDKSTDEVREIHRIEVFENGERLLVFDRTIRKDLERLSDLLESKREGPRTEEPATPDAVTDGARLADEVDTADYAKAYAMNLLIKALEELQTAHSEMQVKLAQAANDLEFKGLENFRLTWMPEIRGWIEDLKQKLEAAKGHLEDTDQPQDFKGRIHHDLFGNRWGSGYIQWLMLMSTANATTDMILMALGRVRGMSGSAGHMNQLFLNILKRGYFFTSEDLSKMIGRVVETYREEIATRGLHFKIEIEPGLVSPHIDTDLLTSVVDNLIQNAMKYTAQGSISVQIARGSYPAPGKDEEGILFSVTDTGIGIPAGELNAVMSGRRASNVGDIRGTGFGLNSVRAVLTLMGATLHVHSVEGQGSTFTAVFPELRSEDASSGARLALPAWVRQLKERLSPDPFKVLSAQEQDRLKPLLVESLKERLKESVEESSVVIERTAATHAYLSQFPLTLKIKNGDPQSPLATLSFRIDEEEGKRVFVVGIWNVGAKYQNKEVMSALFSYAALITGSEAFMIHPLPEDIEKYVYSLQEKKGLLKSIRKEWDGTLTADIDRGQMESFLGGARLAGSLTDTFVSQYFGMDFEELAALGFDRNEVVSFLHFGYVNRSASFYLLENEQQALSQAIRQIVRMRSRGERELSVLFAGVGKENREILSTAHLISETLKADMAASGKGWTVHFTALDASASILKNADRQFKDLERTFAANGVTLKIRPIQVDFLNADALRAVRRGSPSRRFDIILNRHVSYGNHVAALGEMQLDRIPSLRPDVRLQVLNIYSQLRNLIPILASPRTVFVMETTRHEDARAGLTIPGALTFSRPKDGIFVIEQPSRMAGIGLKGFLDANQVGARMAGRSKEKVLFENSVDDIHTAVRLAAIQIEKWLKNKPGRPVLVLLDGRSGKSELAAAIDKRDRWYPNTRHSEFYPATVKDLGLSLDQPALVVKGDAFHSYFRRTAHPVAHKHDQDSSIFYREVQILMQDGARIREEGIRYQRYLPELIGKLFEDPALFDPQKSHRVLVWDEIESIGAVEKDLQREEPSLMGLGEVLVVKLDLNTNLRELGHSATVRVDVQVKRYDLRPRGARMAVDAPSNKEIDERVAAGTKEALFELLMEALRWRSEHLWLAIIKLIPSFAGQFPALTNVLGALASQANSPRVRREALRAIDALLDKDGGSRLKPMPRGEIEAVLEKLSQGKNRPTVRVLSMVAGEAGTEAVEETAHFHSYLADPRLAWMRPEGPLDTLRGYYLENAPRGQRRLLAVKVLDSGARLALEDLRADFMKRHPSSEDFRDVERLFAALEEYLKKAQSTHHNPQRFERSIEYARTLMDWDADAELLMAGLAFPVFEEGSEAFRALMEDAFGYEAKKKTDLLLPMMERAREVLAITFDSSIGDDRTVPAWFNMMSLIMEDDRSFRLLTAIKLERFLSYQGATGHIPLNSQAVLEIMAVYRVGASRRGLDVVAEQLEDAVHRATDRRNYEEFERRYDRFKVPFLTAQFALEMNELLEDLNEKLEKAGVKVRGYKWRIKSKASIYTKIYLQRRKPSLATLNDFVGVRVIVEEPRAAIGLIGTEALAGLAVAFDEPEEKKYGYNVDILWEPKLPGLAEVHAELQLLSPESAVEYESGSNEIPAWFSYDLISFLKYAFSNSKYISIPRQRFRPSAKRFEDELPRMKRDVNVPYYRLTRSGITRFQVAELPSGAYPYDLAVELGLEPAGFRGFMKVQGSRGNIHEELLAHPQEMLVPALPDQPLRNGQMVVAVDELPADVIAKFGSAAFLRLAASAAFGSDAKMLMMSSQLKKRYRRSERMPEAVARGEAIAAESLVAEFSIFARQAGLRPEEAFAMLADAENGRDLMLMEDFESFLARRPTKYSFSSLFGQGWKHSTEAFHRGRELFVPKATELLAHGFFDFSKDLHFHDWTYLFAALGDGVYDKKRFAADFMAYRDSGGRSYVSSAGARLSEAGVFEQAEEMVASLSSDTITPAFRERHIEGVYVPTDGAVIPSSAPGQDWNAPTFDELREAMLRKVSSLRVVGHFDDRTIEFLRRTAALSFGGHQFLNKSEENRFRRFGKDRIPYIVHPIDVGMSSAHEFGAIAGEGKPPVDAVLVAAAFLHDAFEDTLLEGLTLEEFVRLLSPDGAMRKEAEEVWYIVHVLTKKDGETDLDYLRRLRRSYHEVFQGDRDRYFQMITIKLADRLSNFRHNLFAVPDTHLSEDLVQKLVKDANDGLLFNKHFAQFAFRSGFAYLKGASSFWHAESRRIYEEQSVRIQDSRLLGEMYASQIVNSLEPSAFTETDPYRNRWKGLGVQGEKVFEARILDPGAEDFDRLFPDYWNELRPSFLPVLDESMKIGYPEDMAAYLKAPDTDLEAIVLLNEKGKVVGGALYNFKNDWIDSVFVHEDHRGYGGTHILLEIIKRSRQRRRGSNDINEGTIGINSLGYDRVPITQLHEALNVGKGIPLVPEQFAEASKAHVPGLRYHIPERHKTILQTLLKKEDFLAGIKTSAEAHYQRPLTLKQMEPVRSLSSLAKGKEVLSDGAVRRFYERDFVVYQMTFQVEASDGQIFKWPVVVKWLDLYEGRPAFELEMARDAAQRNGLLGRLESQMARQRMMSLFARRFDGLPRIYAHWDIALDGGPIAETTAIQDRLYANLEENAFGRSKNVWRLSEQLGRLKKPSLVREAAAAVIRNYTVIYLRTGATEMAFDPKDVLLMRTGNTFRVKSVGHNDWMHGIAASQFLHRMRSVLDHELIARSVAEDQRSAIIRQAVGEAIAAEGERGRYFDDELRAQALRRALDASEGGGARLSLRPDEILERQVKEERLDAKAKEIATHQALSTAFLKVSTFVSAQKEAPDAGKILPPVANMMVHRALDGFQMAKPDQPAMFRKELAKVFRSLPLEEGAKQNAMDEIVRIATETSHVRDILSRLTHKGSDPEAALAALQRADMGHLPESWAKTVMRDFVGLLEAERIKIEGARLSIAAEPTTSGAVSAAASDVVSAIAAGKTEFDRFQALTGSIRDLGADPLRGELAMLGLFITDWAIRKNLSGMIGQSGHLNSIEGIPDETLLLHLADPMRSLDTFGAIPFRRDADGAFRSEDGRLHKRVAVIWALLRRAGTYGVPFSEDLREALKRQAAAWTREDELALRGTLLEVEGYREEEREPHPLMTQRPLSLLGTLRLIELTSHSPLRGKFGWLEKSARHIVKRADLDEVTKIVYAPVEGDGARLASRPGKKPLAQIPAAEIKSIYLHLSTDISQSKLGEEIIDAYPVISGLKNRFPDAEILVRTVFPGAYMDAVDDHLKIVNDIPGIADLVFDFSRGGVLQRRQWEGRPPHQIDIMVAASKVSIDPNILFHDLMVYTDRERSGSLLTADLGDFDIEAPSAVYDLSYRMARAMGLEPDPPHLLFPPNRFQRALHRLETAYFEGKQGWVPEVVKGIPVNLNSLDKFRNMPFDPHKDVVLLNFEAVTQENLLTDAQIEEIIIGVLMQTSAYLLFQSKPGDAPAKFRLMGHLRRAVSRVLRERPAEAAELIDRMIYDVKGLSLLELQDMIGLSVVSGGGVLTIDTGISHFAALYRALLSVLVDVEYQRWLPMGADRIDVKGSSDPTASIREGVRAFTEKVNENPPIFTTDVPVYTVEHDFGVLPVLKGYDIRVHETHYPRIKATHIAARIARHGKVVSNDIWIDVRHEEKVVVVARYYPSFPKSSADGHAPGRGRALLRSILAPYEGYQVVAVASDSLKSAFLAMPEFQAITDDTSPGSFVDISEKKNVYWTGINLMAVVPPGLDDPRKADGDGARLAADTRAFVSATDFLRHAVRNRNRLVAATMSLIREGKIGADYPIGRFLEFDLAVRGELPAEGRPYALAFAEGEWAEWYRKVRGAELRDEWSRPVSIEKPYVTAAKAYQGPLDERTVGILIDDYLYGQLQILEKYLEGRSSEMDAADREMLQTALETLKSSLHDPAQGWSGLRFQGGISVVDNDEVAAVERERALLASDPARADAAWQVARHTRAIMLWPVDDVDSDFKYRHIKTTSAEPIALGNNGMDFTMLTLYLRHLLERYDSGSETGTARDRLAQTIFSALSSDPEILTDRDKLLSLEKYIGYAAAGRPSYPSNALPIEDLEQYQSLLRRNAARLLADVERLGLEPKEGRFSPLGMRSGHFGFNLQQAIVLAALRRPEFAVFDYGDLHTFDAGPENGLKRDWIDAVSTAFMDIHAVSKNPAYRVTSFAVRPIYSQNAAKAAYRDTVSVLQKISSERTVDAGVRLAKAVEPSLPDVRFSEFYGARLSTAVVPMSVAAFPPAVLAGIATAAPVGAVLPMGTSEGVMMFRRDDFSQDVVESWKRSAKGARLAEPDVSNVVAQTHARSIHVIDDAVREVARGKSSITGVVEVDLDPFMPDSDSGPRDIETFMENIKWMRATITLARENPLYAGVQFRFYSRSRQDELLKLALEDGELAQFHLSGEAAASLDRVQLTAPAAEALTEGVGYFPVAESRSGYTHPVPSVVYLAFYLLAMKNANVERMIGYHVPDRLVAEVLRLADDRGLDREDARAVREAMLAFAKGHVSARALQWAERFQVKPVTELLGARLAQAIRTIQSLGQAA